MSGAAPDEAIEFHAVNRGLCQSVAPPMLRSLDGAALVVEPVAALRRFVR
jgi:hypothetical protein